MKKPASASDPLWYKDAIIYEVHARAFFDSDEDGMGERPFERAGRHVDSVAACCGNWGYPDRAASLGPGRGSA